MSSNRIQQGGDSGENRAALSVPKASGQAAYPVPGEVGGRLIRGLIAELRRQGVLLPTGSDILIAASGGSDSTALAILLTKYGRRVLTQGASQVTLVCVDHGWRGAVSAADGDWVEALARSLGANAIQRQAQPLSAYPKGESLEAFARQERYRILQGLAEERSAEVWTAHHADDQAATVLWRILTGSLPHRGQGILSHAGVFRRPFLFARKCDLEEFLKEEGVVARPDSTNSDLRFQRNRLNRLIRLLETEFPNTVKHLCAVPSVVSENEPSAVTGRELEEARSAWIAAGAPALRRAQFDEMGRAIDAERVFQGPRGWTLRPERDSFGKKRHIVEAPRDMLDSEKVSLLTEKGSPS